MKVAQLKNLECIKITKRCLQVLIKNKKEKERPLSPKSAKVDLRNFAIFTGPGRI